MSRPWESHKVNRVLQGGLAQTDLGRRRRFNLAPGHRIINDRPQRSLTQGEG